VILLLDKLMDDDENPIGLIKILFLELLYLTTIAVDVPIPTDSFEFNVNLIESPFTNK
jgi:hypothetical protein